MAVDKLEIKKKKKPAKKFEIFYLICLENIDLFFVNAGSKLAILTEEEFKRAITKVRGG